MPEVLFLARGQSEKHSLSQDMQPYESTACRKCRKFCVLRRCAAAWKDDLAEWESGVNILQKQAAILSGKEIAVLGHLKAKGFSLAKKAKER